MEVMEHTLYPMLREQLQWSKSCSGQWRLADRWRAISVYSGCSGQNRVAVNGGGYKAPLALPKQSCSGQNRVAVNGGTGSHRDQRRAAGRGCSGQNRVAVNGGSCRQRRGAAPCLSCSGQNRVAVNGGWYSRHSITG